MSASKWLAEPPGKLPANMSYPALHARVPFAPAPIFAEVENEMAQRGVFLDALAERAYRERQARERAQHVDSCRLLGLCWGQTETGEHRWVASYSTVAARTGFDRFRCANVDCDAMEDRRPTLKRPPRRERRGNRTGRIVTGLR